MVLAHGVLELSCIAVSGYAGFRLASAIVDPGTRPWRRCAEARAVEIVLGTMFWLVVAGLVEGFLTPAGRVDRGDDRRLRPGRCIGVWCGGGGGGAEPPATTPTGRRALSWR
jgi:hypothetical protein